MWFRKKYNVLVQPNFTKAQAGNSKQKKELITTNIIYDINPPVSFRKVGYKKLYTEIKSQSLKRSNKMSRISIAAKITLIAILLVCLILPVFGQKKTGKLVPIKIKLPKPMFIGTPQNLKVPNLKKPLGKARPPFLAPVGTKNLALGKPITSTDEEPIIGEIELINDDDREAADGSYVELGPFLQHITIDLGAKSNIYALVVWHFHKQPRIYFDVIVQVSNDKDFVKDVITIFNNDIDNSAGLGVGKNMHYVETSEGKLIDAKGVQGRYVRLYSNGNNNNDLNHYIEVEVYGTPVSEKAK